VTIASRAEYAEEHEVETRQLCRLRYVEPANMYYVLGKACYYGYVFDCLM